jgi:hypothetical protein
MSIPRSPTREIVFVENVTIPPGRARGLDEAAVDRLAESMKKLGLRTPISVRMDGDDLLLVAGRHRLEAARRLGWERIDAVHIEGDEADARLWEISENLHRAELSQIERDLHINEWRLLTVEKGAHRAPPCGGKHPNDRGHYKTAETLGVSRDAVSRAEKTASLPASLLEQAVAEGWSRKHAHRVAQPAQKAPPVAAEPLEEDEAVEAQVKRLMAAWNGAGPDARAEFLRRVGP